MKKLIWLGSFTSLLAACGPSAEEKSKAMTALAEARFASAMEDSMVLESPSYFISEQHVRGKTKDVAQLVQQMEMYVNSKKGYVEQSELNSEILERKDIRLSKDTLGTLTRYRKVAELKLRIPYFLLDSAKMKLAHELVFIENSGSSNVHAEADLIASTAQQGLNEVMVEKSAQEQSKKKSGAKIIMQQQEHEQTYREQALEANVNKLKLEEAIMYATLNISLSGEEEMLLEKQLLLNELKPYEPSFFEKLGERLYEGFEGLKTFVLWISGLWVPLLLIALGVWQYKEEETAMDHCLTP